MRKVLRHIQTLDYWNRRWSAFEGDQEEFLNMHIYPIKYVNPHIRENTKVLEAGCGLGRVIKHYKKRGVSISGCDYSSVAVEKLNREYPNWDVRQADIAQLPYQDKEFDVVLALGVFHGIEDPDAIGQGIGEAWRCLKTRGRLIASVRADNFENRIIDGMTERHGTQFHKWCFRRNEFQAMLEKRKFKVETCELATNVSFLHKFRILRKHPELREDLARSRGFEINAFGRVIYKILKAMAPESFGTTYVYTAIKSET